MNLNKILVPIAIVLFTVGAWRQFGWPGIAMAAGGVVMWILLHFTRLMTVLKRAANRPVGHVASAVMLNAKLLRVLYKLPLLAMEALATCTTGASLVPVKVMVAVEVLLPPRPSLTV